MIKPFEILSTRPEPDGTGVMYRVSKTSMEDGAQVTKTIESYMLVPAGCDLDREVFSHLKASGWLE